MTSARPAAALVMHGAREAFASGLTHIEAQIEGIERAVVENPALAFDLARTLVETACRTILSERKIDYRDADDLPALFRSACDHLPFLPPSASSEKGARRSLRQTLGGISTAVQGICELRNRCGFASHGSGQPRPAMESVQAHLAAQAADTIVGFLFRVHCQDRDLAPTAQALYDENVAFNDYLDGAFGPVQILDVEFQASEVLLVMDPEGYRVYSTEFGEGDGQSGDSGDGVVEDHA